MAYKNFLGYEKGEDGLPKIVEEEAKIVRDIYKLFLEGKNYKQIADYLTDRSIKTPGGKDVWSYSTVRSILTNEKYMGDARLQKTYIEDFLTKKVKKNNGERKQIYIHDSHDSIVSKETFMLVQQEIERRGKRQGRYYDSPFSGKIYCGSCQGLYGHRVWHSKESCRKEVWICNDKYDHDIICRTPAITEDKIKKAYLTALNRIVSNKHYCEEYKEKYYPLIGDTRDLDRALSKASKEKYAAIDKIEQLVADNAKRAQQQDLYQKSYDTLSTYIDEKNNEIDSIKQQISETAKRKENARIFLQGLADLEYDLVVKQFDIRSWHALVDYATVMPNKTIVFHFRNGLEETVDLEG